MNEPSASFVLTATNGDTPPLLERVDVDGRIDGVLFTVSLRQTWRHQGARPQEVVYTFPLPPDALLLSFAARRGDEWLQGNILPRARAEARYEEALERGDAPALLEVGAGGLHTASIGNLAPGETVVLELRFAQLLRFEHGRLRLVVPTTVAPRYGQPESGGLAPHQAPLASLTAEYPLSLALTVAGSLAGARLECPTHRHLVSRSGGNLRFELEPGARMDRDVVVVLCPDEPRAGLLVTGRDPLSERPRQVALAAFELPRRPSGRPLSLKLLLDGSGSMAGDSMVSAQAALRAIADRLGADDEVALVRFGSGHHIALAPSPCTAATLRALRQQIDTSAANSGGTEMQSALRATLSLPHGREQADVLLITDGQVWAAQAVAAAARRSGQRIFAIGVGSAPAEGALREIASASGGACEFATPGDDLRAAATRMLERMRDTPWTGLRVDWAHTPAWASSPTAPAFGGDTFIAMAAFDGDAPAGVRLELGASDAALVATTSQACDAEELARVLADHERRQQGAGQAEATAVRYRLLTEHTHCVLVHVRDARERTSTPAELVRVPSMLAAGWGGTGRVASPGTRYSLLAQAAPLTAGPDVDACMDFAPAQDPFDDIRFSRRPASSTGDFCDRLPVFSQTEADPAPATDLQRLQDLEALLPAGEARSWLALWAIRQPLPEPGRRLIDALRRLGLGEVDAWIVFVYAALVADPTASPSLPDWAGQRLNALDPRTRTDALAAVASALGREPPAGWGRRARRLIEAMRR